MNYRWSTDMEIWSYEVFESYDEALDYVKNNKEEYEGNIVYIAESKDFQLNEFLDTSIVHEIEEQINDNIYEIMESEQYQIDYDKEKSLELLSLISKVVKKFHEKHDINMNFYKIRNIKKFIILKK